MSFLRTAGPMIAAIAALAGAAPASAKPGPGKPAVDPDAIAVLHKMGEFLRNQQHFSVQARMTTDDVLPSGQKVQYGGTVDLKVRRPDRMRMDIAGDRRNEQIFYDGNTFTIFSPRTGFYAAFDGPKTLDRLKDVHEKKYPVDLPLADLFYWGMQNDATASITRATRIGAANVDGFVCDHYAFRQKDVDWELWIEQGGRPLPRKEVITTTAERTQPQHSMILNWDLNAKFDDQLFAFVPPPNAHHIDFDTDHKTGGGK